MGSARVGIREFRERLANYLLESDQPIAITRHGDTVGYYIPALRKRSETERSALKEAVMRLEKVLTEAKVTEEDSAADFKSWRRRERR
jgi:PHD/YefM family antitoxin component YafN of YafNO toxin-antitoxin module